MKRNLMSLALVASVVAAVVIPAASRAQWVPVLVPVTPPAYYCVTQTLTCGLVAALPAGASCACLTPSGWWVAGVAL